MSRKILAPLTLVALLFAASRSRGDALCPVYGLEDVAKATLIGEVSVDRGSGPSVGVRAAYGFSLTSSDHDGWSPTAARGDAVDFAFSFVEGSSSSSTIRIDCQRASFAALGSGSTLSLTTLCGQVKPDGGASATSEPAASLRVRATVGTTPHDVWLVFDLTTVDGSASGASSLDANGDGTVDVSLDIPSTTRTSSAILDVASGVPVTNAAPVSVTFAATKLHGTATFVTSSQDSCPPSGGCDCGGTYHGWMPGGG